ncbi:MAG: outer membrane lipoprotein carrier protein LolA [Bacteroidales bacterium]|nr:outer membrane lipoprotein carrier protein LolA [Bacteroidales bacterium]MDY0216737.1 outer membrane lipoprotein carrier protein LolA [Bacteroidales bacterium]
MKTTTLIIAKKSFLLFCFLMLLNPISSWAQLNDSSAEILDKVSKKTKSYKTIKINFIFKQEKDKVVQNTVKGSVWVKGDKYRYTFNDQVLYCDGKTTWTHSQEVNEVSINNANTEEETINPAFILDDYKTKFKPRMIRETTVAGRIVQVIDLFPLKAQSYSRIRVEIDKLKQQLMQLSIIEKSGEIYTYSITSFVPNQAIEDAIFIFDPAKHKDIEIIDMR